MSENKISIVDATNPSNALTVTGAGSLQMIPSSAAGTANISVPGPNLGSGLVVTSGTLVATTSLNAVTAAAVGSVVDAGAAHSTWTVQSASTGTLTGTVHLEVSLDNVTFSDVASGAVPAGGAFQSTFTIAARYARAELTTTTGTGTITSKIMAA